jgi:oligosaccharide repeat unit polymerase
VLPLIVIVVLLVAAISIPLGEPVFIALPMVALAVVSVPIIRDPNYDVLSPWSMIWLSVLFGVTLRGLYIALEWPDFESINARFLLGQDDGFFFFPTVILVVSLGALVAGYSVRTRFRVRSMPSLWHGDQWDKQRYSLLLFACVSVSLLAFILYVQATGGFDPNRLSNKRVAVPGLELPEGFQTYGHWRFLAGFAGIAAILAWVDFCFSGRKMTFFRFLGLGALLLNALLLDVYASTRSGALWVLILFVAIWVMSGRRLRLGTAAVVVLVGLLTFQLMTYARDDARGSVETPPLHFAQIIDPLVLNRNLLGLAKTAHIIDAVPDRLDYALGRTYVAPLVAPIPRILWSGKPIVGSGKQIGAAIFGTEGRSGVPPGLAAEAYWNFGIVGILVVPFVLGLGLRRTYETLRPFVISKNSAVLYLVLIFPVGFNLIGIEVGRGLTNTLIDGAQFALALSFITKTRSGRR